MKFSRPELVEMLQKNIVKVIFKKVDGSTRVMECTLISAFLPQLEGSSTKKSEKVIPVWDLEKEAWRSFRVDNVIDVEKL